MLGIATRSGIVTTQNVAGTSLSYSVSSDQLAAGSDGNLWFTSGDSGISRISGLDTPSGTLDNAHRPKKAPDWIQGAWTNVTGNARPTFAGDAKPGAELTLFVRKQGETQPVPIGQVQANSKDGSWQLTSQVALGNGNYEVTAIQQGDPGPPSVLYSLEPDSTGNLSSALVIAVPQKATPKGTIALQHASPSRRSSGH